MLHEHHCSGHYIGNLSYLLNHWNSFKHRTPPDNTTNTQFPYYTDVIMGAIASQIISLTVVYSTVYSDADQRKDQSSTSLAFVRGIHRGPVDSPHKWPVTRKMFPFDDVIMIHNLQKNHGDSTFCQGTRTVVPIMIARATSLITNENISIGLHSKLTVANMTKYHLVWLAFLSRSFGVLPGPMRCA